MCWITDRQRHDFRKGQIQSMKWSLRLRSNQGYPIRDQARHDEPTTDHGKLKHSENKGER